MTEITLQEYTREIEGMLERSAYDEAIAHCKHILQEYPKFVEPYRLIGQAAFDRDDHKQASDMFQRILSANPSDFVSRAGLAVIHDKLGSLKDAVWQMERAYEIEPGNGFIQEELRKLYGRRDGVMPERPALTRGALARLYMNGELYSEAAVELRALLAMEPDRVDLQAMLIEALWRDEQRLEASETASKLLEKMPYCLDANLILGEIWMMGGREEDAEVHLKRALALDPEGKRAAELFGKLSPVPTKPVEIAQLEYAPPAGAPVSEEAPTWLTGIGAPAEAATGMEEIPAWLQGMGLPTPAETPQEAPPVEAEEAQVSSWLASLGTAAAQAPATPSPEEEQAPDWLTQMRAEPGAPAETVAEAPVAEEIPDWLQSLKPTEAAQPAPAVEEQPAQPDWLAQLRAEAAPEAPQAAAEEGIPDWLMALRPEGAEQPQPAVAAVEEPEWLTQLHAEAETLPGVEEAAAPEAAMAGPEPAEIPDWLQMLKPKEAEAVQAPEWMEALPTEAEAQPAEAPAPAAEEAPAWMAEGGAMPSPEEALAFFQRLTAGKEEQLAAQAQAEAEVRMAEITGRAPAPRPAEPTPEVPPPPKVEVPAPAPVEAPPPPEAEAPAPAAEEAPAWMAEGGAMPSPEEALAFFQRLTAGKEEQLAAQAQAEAEVRMAEITGRAPAPRPAEPTPEVPPPPKVEAPVPVEEPPPPKAEVPAPAAEEAPAWMAEGAAMPSPEEALAFFQRLTAGKEEQLAAQAQAEAEVRMAEITGRTPAPKPEAPAPTPEIPAPVAEQPPVEAIEEAPVTKVPEGLSEWLAAQATEFPEVEAAPAEAIPSEWEPLMQPPAIEAWPVAAVGAGVIAAFAAEQAEEITLPVAEAAEAAPAAARQPVVGTTGPDWWYQTLEDEEGPSEEAQAALAAEAAPAEKAVPLTQVMPLVEEKKAVTAPPPPIPVAPTPAKQVVAPPPAPSPRATKRLVRAKPAPATPPQPVVDIESIMARLRANPDDHQALLDLARGWKTMGDMKAAREGYEELVHRNISLDDVISDLENVIEDQPSDVDSIRLLGDAHMKAGNLQKALKLYRQALKRL